VRAQGRTNWGLRAALSTLAIPHIRSSSPSPVDRGTRARRTTIPLERGPCSDGRVGSLVAPDMAIRRVLSWLPAYLPRGMVDPAAVSRTIARDAASGSPVEHGPTAGSTASPREDESESAGVDTPYHRSSTADRDGEVQRRSTSSPAPTRSSRVKARSVLAVEARFGGVLPEGAIDSGPDRPAVVLSRTARS